ncbi:unnamed protein product [Arabis nemorensis]|uniref:TF-B3 domain-containing protein n=1 Tax=Arabis nemorensis TaxID=586526 RepID=A0A565BNJ4_9BRAS|nr:unnamed protein product [Arabis nemorensis]
MASSSIASSSMASSSKRSRSPTPEEDDEDEKPRPKKFAFDLNEEPEPELEEDDSDATLALLRRWNVPATPPAKMVHPGLIGLCSKPIRMQLTKKDVNFEDEKQSKLVLSKSKLTNEFDLFVRGKEWMVVSVYGPDGKIHEIKMWIDEKEDKIDLKKGWSKFVGDYDLKEICDFVAVWMFWNKEGREICLAIDTMRLVVRKLVSQRISKAVFDDED